MARTTRPADGEPVEQSATEAPDEALSPDAEQAAAKRAAALGGGDSRHVDALLVERRGYVIRGLEDRVAQVDAELERLGHPLDTKPSTRKA